MDKNHTLENNLLNTQDMMAVVIAQNKLLQDQLLALNKGSSLMLPTTAPNKDIQTPLRE
jgi:hypothetical protein